MNNIEDGELQSYYDVARMQDASMRAYLDMMFMNLPQPAKVNTPMLVLGATEDSLIIPNEVRATAKAYNTHAEFFPDIGHAMMLDNG